MPRERIANLGEVGLNTDVAPTLLPANVVNGLYNVLPINGSLETARGELKLFDLDIEPRYHTAYRSFKFDGPAARQWFIVSDGVDVYAYHLQADGTLITEQITPTDDDTATGTKEPWLGGLVSFADLNGVLVVNSETDGPFYWPGPGAPTTNPLVGLPGWDAGWTCTYMVAHRYGLFALGMTESGNYYPYKLRWSNSAAEGQLPTEWVATASNDAGDDLLGETPGVIKGGASVRGQLFIVKEDAVYRARWVGGQFIYAVERLQGTIGTTAPQGWSEVQGTLAILTGADVLLYDGQRQVSITDKAVRTAIFEGLSPEYWERCQLYYHAPTERLYVATVAEGSRLSEAHVYDSINRTWGHRTLNQTLGFDTAYITLTLDGRPWDDMDDFTWNEWVDATWNKGIYQSSTPDIVLYESNGRAPSDPEVKYWVSMVSDVRNKDSLDRVKNCTVRKIGLPINGASGLAMITDVWFELFGINAIKFRVGAQEVEGGAITWGPWYEGNAQTELHLDTRLTGRFLAWEIQSQNDNRWALSAITYNWESAGER